MRISKARLILAAMLFALLSGCMQKQPPTTGAWSDFSNQKAKETKEAPKAE